MVVASQGKRGSLSRVLHTQSSMRIAAGPACQLDIVFVFIGFRDFETRQSVADRMWRVSVIGLCHVESASYRLWRAARLSPRGPPIYAMESAGYVAAAETSCRLSRWR
jgi:hypothetical protein